MLGHSRFVLPHKPYIRPPVSSPTKTPPALPATRGTSRSRQSASATPPWCRAPLDWRPPTSLATTSHSLALLGCILHHHPPLLLCPTPPLEGPLFQAPLPCWAEGASPAPSPPAPAGPHFLAGECATELETLERSRRRRCGVVGTRNNNHNPPQPHSLPTRDPDRSRPAPVAPAETEDLRRSRTPRKGPPVWPLAGRAHRPLQSGVH